MEGRTERPAGVVEAAGFGLVVFGLVRIRTRSLEAQSAVLEQQVKERTNELQEQKEHIEQAYEKLKALTRGQSINQETMTEFVNSLEIPEEAKKVLLDLTPASYIGNAVEQARAIDS